MPEAPSSAAFASPAVVSRPEFYKRELPPTCVSFASLEGKRMFQSALADGSMECYFPLAAQFRTQDEPAFCGLSSLVMTLNALSIDPRKPWKGPWRWFSEDNLDCCLPRAQIQAGGMDMDSFACVARCNACNVEVHRPPPVAGGAGDSLEQFRSDVQALSRSSDEFAVLSYARSGVGQTGGGHFSPLGGYASSHDAVLVLDVARFKYPPHWVPLPLMYAAMRGIDAETGRPRGWLKLRRSATAPLLLYHYNAARRHAPAHAQSACFAQRMYGALDAALKSCTVAVRNVGEGRDLKHVVGTFVAAFTGSAQVGSQALACIDKLSREHIDTTSRFMDEIESMALFKLVAAATPVAASAAGEHTCGGSCVQVGTAHVITLLMMAWASAPAGAVPASGAAYVISHAVGHALSGASPMLVNEVRTIAAHLRANGCALHEDAAAVLLQPELHVSLKAAV